MIPIAPYYQRQRAIRAAEKKIGRAPRIVALALRRIRQERATLSESSAGLSRAGSRFESPRQAPCIWNLWG